MNPPISSNFYSICQGTHPAKTNLCRNSPTKGARNIGSAQAQELIGSNDLVTCLESKAREIPNNRDFDPFRILSVMERLQEKKNSLKKLQTLWKQEQHIAAVLTLPFQMERLLYTLLTEKKPGGTVELWSFVVFLCHVYNSHQLVSTHIVALV